MLRSHGGRRATLRGFHRAIRRARRHPVRTATTDGSPRVGYHPMALEPRPTYDQAMTRKLFRTSDTTSLIVGASFLAVLTGCLTDRSYPRSGYRSGPSVQVTASIGDDYDYYPGYEVYYNRTRREYVYRDGNAWVRRPQPRGVTTNVLFASPSVRLDFHDSPELHHSTVVKSYPRNWAPPGKGHDDKGDRKNDNKNDRKPDDRKN